MLRMNSLPKAAAQALREGDPLRALKLVGLQEDAQALALRATAMAQLGEFKRAKQLFLRAARTFEPDQEVARARCIVALAEVALAARELSPEDTGLLSAVAVLERHRDLANARYAEFLRARHALALGDVAVAAERLRALEDRSLSPALRAQLALARAEIALRRVQPKEAQKALSRAAQAALSARIPALMAEVRSAQLALDKPVARLVSTNATRPLSLDQVAALLGGGALIVDACRRVIGQRAGEVSFATRPVLFALARRLAEASPAEVTREELLRVAFGMHRQNDALRARLRVSVGRLRKMLAALAELKATAGGYALVPRHPPTYVLAPPLDDEASQLLALVSDGQAWSTSALALAQGSSQRSVQRALSSLEAAGKVHSLGRGRSRRWLAPPLSLFATHLLLPTASRAP
jgi:DNA-binding transcriptional ArsR family regulator